MFVSSTSRNIIYLTLTFPLDGGGEVIDTLVDNQLKLFFNLRF